MTREGSSLEPLDPEAVHDCRLGADVSTPLPTQSGWHTYLYVFEGPVEVDEEPSDTPRARS